MIIDTSALLAILYEEPDAHLYERAIIGAPHPRMSAANYLEATIVVERRSGRDKGLELEELVTQHHIQLVPVTLDQMEVARQAWRAFGEGRGKQPAVLNYGDCFAYALARVSREPLLFKGDDFAQTDISPPKPPPNPRAARLLRLAYDQKRLPRTSQKRRFTLSAYPNPANPARRAQPSYADCAHA